MKVAFKNNNKSEFFVTLHKRVDEYFKVNNIDKTANPKMVTKTVFILSTFFSIYVLLLTDAFSNVYLSWLLCAILGLFTAFIGFNISHDAVHGSYSHNPTLNRFLGYTFDMLGASSYMWNIAHNVVHHTYTNVPNHDDDIEPVFLIRLNPEKKVLWIHRYQHYYAMFFYCLTSLSWVFLKDYEKMFAKNIGGSYTQRKHKSKDIIFMFAAKFTYYFVFIILPMLLLDYAWWQVAIGFVTLHVFEGLTLAIVFQLAHTVEEADFPLPDENGSIENSWAVHQLHTTADFAQKSKLATFLFGGLNFQVEHHLFPKICHIHYPKIAEIVKATAEEFDIPYNTNRTMLDAIKSHLRILKQFGQPQLVSA